MKVKKRNCVGKFTVLMLLFSIFPIELIADTLVDAAQAGSMDKVKQLIEGGYDVNAKEQNGYTALIISAEMGNLELVKYLVSKGADINATNKYDANALHKVLDAEQPGTKKLSGNRIQIAHYLISNGINVKAKGYNDTTALHVAIFRGDISVIESLLKNGADINAKTKKGRTPLSIAKVLKSKRVIELLSNPSYSNDVAYLTSNANADSVIQDSVDKSDENETKYEQAILLTIFGIAAMLFRSVTPLPRLVLIFGTVGASLGVIEIWSLGHAMLAVSITLIVTFILTFPIWFPMLDKKLSKNKDNA